MNIKTKQYLISTLVFIGILLFIALVATVPVISTILIGLIALAVAILIITKSIEFIRSVIYNDWS